MFTFSLAPKFNFKLIASRVDTYFFLFCCLKIHAKRKLQLLKLSIKSRESFSLRRVIHICFLKFQRALASKRSRGDTNRGRNTSKQRHSKKREESRPNYVRVHLPCDVCRLSFLKLIGQRDKLSPSQPDEFHPDGTISRDRDHTGWKVRFIGLHGRSKEQV